MAPEDVEAPVVLAERLSDVMSRVPIDLDKALLEDNGAAVIAAARECARCPSAARHSALAWSRRRRGARIEIPRGWRPADHAKEASPIWLLEIHGR